MQVRLVRHEGSGQVKRFPVREHDETLLNAGQPAAVSVPPSVVPRTVSAVKLAQADNACERSPVSLQTPELP